MLFETFIKTDCWCKSLSYDAGVISPAVLFEKHLHMWW